MTSTSPKYCRQDLVVGLLLAGVLLTLGFYRIRDPDIWLYLASGREMVATGEVLRCDIFSYTRTGVPWINHSWGSQLIFFLVHQAGGTAGLYLTRWILLGTAFLGIYLASRRHLEPYPAGVLLLAGILGASGRFVIRPELFTFIGLTWLFQLLDGPPRRFWLIPVLLLVWANLHGGVILGLGFLAAWTAGTLLDGLRRREGFAPVRPLLPVALASLVAVTITPNGPGGLLYSAKIGQLKEFIYVWQPFTIGRIGSWSLSQWSFPLLVLLAAGSFFVAGRRIRFSLLLVAAALAIGGALANRNIFLFALIFPAVAAANFAGLNLPRTGRLLFLSLAGISLVFSILYPLSLADPYGSSIHHRFGWGTCSTVFPLKTSNFIEEQGLEARIFNTFGIGSYLAWRLWPGHEIFVDSRLAVYGEDFLLEYNQVLIEPEFFGKLARRWGFHLALVDYANPSNHRLLRWLETSPNWGLANYDADSALYVRSDFPGNTEIAEQGLARARQQNLSPREAAAVGKFLLLIGHPVQARHRLEEAARARPDSSTVNFLLARAWAETGNWEETLRHCGYVLAEEENPSVRLLAAHVHLACNQPEEALREAELALKGDPDLLEGFAFLGDLQAGLGREDEALKAYREAKRRDDFPADSALIAGKILLQAGRAREAAEFFALPRPGEWNYPEARLSLAGALARSGRKPEAVTVYREVILNSPTLADHARHNLAVVLFELGREEEAAQAAAAIADHALKNRLRETLPGLIVR